MHIVTVFAVIAAYFFPSIIAFIRGHASKWAILLINAFGGWTVIAWIWMLIWALANKGASQTVIVHNGAVITTDKK